MKEYDFDPRNLPKDLLAAIGLAITSSAQTEGIVEMLIAGCVGVDSEYGGATPTHMTMHLRFSVLRSDAEIRIDDVDALDELDELIEHADDAFTKRNAIAHHAWCRDPKTEEVFTVKQTARVSFQMDLIPMSIDQVK